MSNETADFADKCSRIQGLLKYERERFSSQLSFAEFLVKKNKYQRNEWEKVIAQASDAVGKAFAGGNPALVKEAVRNAEEAMAPLSEEAKTYTLYAAGHAHIDMNWMWSWPETVNLTNDTFTTVLRLFEEFPEFHFSQSQASVYRIIEMYNPEMLDRIREYVDEGRWEVTASHWVEGDKNIAGSEALCRHLLYTRRYMKKIFGLSPEDVPVDWCPDTFGQAHTVPLYLTRGSVKYVYMHRPGRHTPPQPRPRVFRWRSPDGSEVIVKNDMHVAYNGVMEPGYIKKALTDFSDETGLKFGLFVYGVGDHGGGPTRRDLMMRKEMDSWPVYPHIVCSATRTFFAELEKHRDALPVIDDELNFEFSGCYTTQSLIKKSNRYSEKKMADAENVSAVAWAALNRTYNSSGFEKYWRDTLFTHFHDILPGSGVHDTRTYTHGKFQEIMSFTSIEEAEALRALAAEVDTSTASRDIPEHLLPSLYPRSMGGGMGYNTSEGGVSQYGYGRGSDRRAFLIYNPLPYNRKDVVEVILWDPGWGWDSRDVSSIRFRVICPDGSCVNAQHLDTFRYWGHQAITIAFPVNVPSNGYSLYYVEECGGQHTDQDQQPVRIWHEKGAQGLDNGRTRFQVDSVRGGIALLRNSTNSTDIISEKKPISPVEYGIERARGMSAWTIEQAGELTGMEVTNISHGRSGPYIGSICVKGRISSSDVEIIYSLKKSDPALYIDIRCTWFERGSKQKGTPFLRLALPLALENISTVYEIPFGAAARDMDWGEEVPALRWARAAGVSDGNRAGVLLLNDSKHGHSLKGSTLNLTLIRASYDPDILPEIGQHTIKLAVIPFAEPPETHEATARARCFNHELKVVNTDAHEGSLPAQQELITVSPENVVLESVKKCEEENALIFRMYEADGKNASAHITLNRLLGNAAEAVETDVLERSAESSSGSVSVSDNTVTAEITAHSLITVKVILK